MDKCHTTTGCRQSVTRVNTRFAPIGFLLLYSLLLTPCSSIYASEPESALSRMQQRYASVETISGSFRLTYSDLGIEQVESGEFWLKKPALMRWEYRHPEEKLFVADGRETFFYEPLERQVTVQSFTAEELLSTPLKFLLGAQDIEESFFIEPEYEPSEGPGGTRVVRLIPRSEAGYTFLVLEIDGASYDLRRLTIHEQSGNTLEYYFGDLKTNVKVGSGKFRFKIPEGVEVHRMESYE